MARPEKQPVDYPRSQGGAAIGARLRSLSDRVDREADRVYAELGLEFEQRWFGVMNMLAMAGPMSVGELATALGVTHAAVSQTRSALAQRKLVAATTDPADGRRRVITLTTSGEALVCRLRPVWDALNQAGVELNAEAQDAVQSLERLKAALDRESLVSRVKAKLEAVGGPR